MTSPALRATMCSKVDGSIMQEGYSIAIALLTFNDLTMEEMQMEKLDLNWALSHRETFRYRLLSRMKSDCEYYLGNGQRNPKHLWAGNEKRQIEAMKFLWNSFSVEDKPEWLTWKQIEKYEADMEAELNTRC